MAKGYYQLNDNYFVVPYSLYISFIDKITIIKFRFKTFKLKLTIILILAFNVLTKYINTATEHTLTKEPNDATEFHPANSSGKSGILLGIPAIPKNA